MARKRCNRTKKYLLKGGRLWAKEATARVQYLAVRTGIGKAVSLTAGTTTESSDDNSEGCDSMKGEDIVVIGTPHYNEMVYRLFAAHIGIDVNRKMKFMEVEDECYKYWLHTYEDPFL